MNTKLKVIFYGLSPSNESNLPRDATVRSVYSDITYKLNEDFDIGLVEGAPKEPKVRFF